VAQEKHITKKPKILRRKYIMYKFIHEHAARTFAYQQGQNGWDAIVTECEGYWWVEVL
jgi:hypothetical protein